MKTLSLAIVLVIVTWACGSKPGTNSSTSTPSATTVPYYDDMEGYWAVVVKILKEGTGLEPVTSHHTMFFSIPYTGPSVDVLDTAFLAVEDKIIADHHYENPTVGQNYGWLNQDQWSIVGQLTVEGGQVVVTLDQVEDQVIARELKDTWTFLEMTRYENPFDPGTTLMSTGPKGFVVGIMERLEEVGP